MHSSARCARVLRATAAGGLRVAHAVSMRGSVLLLLAIVILLQASVAFAADDYETLVAHEAWLELSMRLETVPVTARDAKWRSAATGARYSKVATPALTYGPSASSVRPVPPDRSSWNVSLNK